MLKTLHFLALVLSTLSRKSSERMVRGRPLTLEVGAFEQNQIFSILALHRR
jgi:hypothetical protein